MPIVVRPEDIRLSKKELKKDILYKLGHEEGFEEGLLISVLTIIRSKLGYIPEGVEEKIKKLKDKKELNNLLERLVVSDDVLKTLKEELEL